MKPILFFRCFFFLCLQVSTLSQAQTPGKITDFTLTAMSGSKSVSLSDYKDSKGVVLLFTSVSCPYAKLYEDRIIGIAKEYQEKGIQFLLINSTTSAEFDNASSTASATKEAVTNMVHLDDREHRVASMFGAIKVPEAIVLQNTAGTFTLKYKGAIDDNPQSASDVRFSYLKEAIQAVLTKKNLAITERRPTGCMIRKE